MPVVSEEYHTFVDSVMLMGNPLSVNIVRKLSNYSWSSDGGQIRLALVANDLMVASLWCLGQNALHLMYNPVIYH